MRKRTKILGISKNQRTKLDILSIFSKRNIFLHFKRTIVFYFNLVLKECNTFDSNYVSFIPSYNQYHTESDIGQGPSNHAAPLYELLVSVL